MPPIPPGILDLDEFLYNAAPQSERRSYPRDLLPKLDKAEAAWAKVCNSCPDGVRFGMEKALHVLGNARNKSQKRPSCVVLIGEHVDQFRRVVEHWRSETAQFAASTAMGKGKQNNKKPRQRTTKLTERDKEILEELVKQGSNMTKAGKSLGISRQRVAAVRDKAAKLLREPKRGGVSVQAKALPKTGIAVGKGKSDRGVGRRLRVAE